MMMMVMNSIIKSTLYLCKLIDQMIMQNTKLYNFCRNLEPGISPLARKRTTETLIKGHL